MGPDPEVIAALRRASRSTFGEFPNGRAGEQDRGAIPMAIGLQDGPNGQVVAIHYAEPVTWTAMPPENAIQMAASLVKFAREAGCTTPLSHT